MALSASRLSPLLAPRSVAIVGASPRENTLGNNVVMNLRRFGYAGRIFPVHPSAPEVAGLPARTRASFLLQSYRGRPAGDADAFAALLVRLSQLGATYGDVLEAVDLNPVAVLPPGRGAIVLDALVVPRKTTSQEGP